VRTPTKHGLNGYHRGCRCQACREAKSAYRLQGPQTADRPHEEPADLAAAHRATFWKYDGERQRAPAERWCCGTADGTEHEGSCPARPRQRECARVQPPAIPQEVTGDPCYRCHRPLQPAEVAVCERCHLADSHDRAVWMSGDSAYAIRTRMGKGIGPPPLETR
jgi:hypothetical protein